MREKIVIAVIVLGIIGVFWMAISLTTEIVNAESKITDSWLARFFSNIQKKEDERNLEILREKDPFLDLIHKEKLQNKKRLQNLIKEIKRPIDLEIIIDHIKEHEKEFKKQGKELYPAFKQLLEDLEHYKSIVDKDVSKLNQATLNTILLGSLAVLLKLAVLAL